MSVVTQRVSIPGDSHAFPFEESLVVVRFPHPCLFLLNPSARLLWECLRDGLDCGEAAGELSAAADIPRETAERDIATAIAQWRQQGLLGPSTPSLAITASAPDCHQPTARPAAGPAAETRTYRFLGRIFEITYADASTWRTIHPRFANLETSDTSAPDFSFEIFPDANETVLLDYRGHATRCESAQAAGYRLFLDFAAAAHPKSRLGAWLHGGVMSRGDTSVITIGLQGSGKSTLNAALLHAGFACFGDDRVLLESGSMQPMASPNSISTKRGSWPVLRARYPELETWPIHRLGERDVRWIPSPPPTSRLAPPARVAIFPRYTPGAKAELVRLDATAALQRMIEAHAWVEPCAQDTEDFLHWVRTLDAYALPYSSIDEAEALVREIVP